MNKQHFTVHENAGYRVRVESWEALAPQGLLCVNFVQECLNPHGEVDFSSTYSYNMTRDEIARLCAGLLKL